MAPSPEDLALAAAEGPSQFIRKLGWTPYPWHDFIYADYKTPTMVVAARQVGKTHCFGGLADFVAYRYVPSLSPIVCPDQDKSKTLIRRVDEIAKRGGLTWATDNTEEKATAEGSRIIGLPGTVKGVVSNTAKLLVFDEAGLMFESQGRDLYSAATPMQGHVDEPLTFAISSAWWEEGWFFEEWDHGHSFKKILVLPRWEMINRRIVPARMNDAELAALWKKKGVFAFYSDYPTRTFLELELSRHTERHMLQQYFCNFLPRVGKVFSSAWIKNMVDPSAVPMHSTLVDPNIKKVESILQEVG